MTENKPEAPALDLAALAGAATVTEVPAVTIVRAKEDNPFVALVAERNANRGQAVKLPGTFTDPEFNKVRRFLSDAAAEAGHSVRVKREKDGLVVWAVDKVTRAPRKAKADAAPKPAAK